MNSFRTQYGPQLELQHHLQYYTNLQNIANKFSLACHSAARRGRIILVSPIQIRIFLFHIKLCMKRTTFLSVILGSFPVIRSFPVILGSVSVILASLSLPSCHSPQKSEPISRSASSDTPTVQQVIDSFDKQLEEEHLRDTVGSLSAIVFIGNKIAWSKAFGKAASHTGGLAMEPGLWGAAAGPIGEWENKVLSSIPAHDQQFLHHTSP
jgi:hypothetical protein